MFVRFFTKVERSIRKRIEKRVMSNCQGEKPSRLRGLSFYLRLRWWLLGVAVNHGLWIPDALNILLVKMEKGGGFLDIGANVGWITSSAGFILFPYGRVYSFEPSTKIFRLLKNRVASLGLYNVEIFNLGLGREKGIGRLHEFAENYGGSSSLRQGAWAGHNEANVSDVHIRSLDSFLEEKQVHNIELIKIDVQGAELDVLNGAHGLLNGKNPPILYIEVEECALGAFGYSRVDLLTEIHQNGYEIYCWRRSGFIQVGGEKDLSNSGHDDVICFKGTRHSKVKDYLHKLSEKAVVHVK